MPWGKRSTTTNTGRRYGQKAQGTAAATKRSFERSSDRIAKATDWAYDARQDGKRY